MRTKLLLILATLGCADLDTDEATESVVATHGLSAEYFRGSLADPHNRVLARIDPNIDLHVGLGAPDPALPVDNFQVRWTGTLTPRFAQRYTFSLPRVDDTARVIIDDQVVIDRANIFSPTSGAIELTAGPHALVVEYAEAWGVAELQLAWQSPSQPLETIPSSQLTPAPTPPAQPAIGPGGADYPHAACTVTKRAIWGNDDLSYWVFEPTGPSPQRAPLVVFDHGWMGNDPIHYAHWLDHLCRRGNVVIFPRYQSLLTLSGFFLPNAAWSVRDALAFLALPGHVHPAVEQGMVLVGHSAGGTVAASMAGTWLSQALPFPRAVFAVEPATNRAVPYVGLAQIPAATAITCLVGNDDTVVGRQGCDDLFAGTPQVPGRRYVWAFSDAHGTPSLAADHFAPSELTPYTDALDFTLLWRLADALRDCAFANTTCAFTPSLGTWSDGVALTPPRITIDAIPACPAASTAVGCP